MSKNNAVEEPSGGVPPTVSGYDFYEVESALQKCIRRGLEKEALFWAHELFLSEPFRPHLWNRLLVIASEDVGIADSSIAVLVHALWETDKRLNDKKPVDDRNTLFMTHAVIALARAPKSRMVDHATGCLKMVIREKLWHPEIPDYALDKHTFRGRNLGRWWKHFRKVGALLVNCKVKDPYEEKCFELKEKYKPMPGNLNGGTETE